MPEVSVPVVTISSNLHTVPSVSKESSSKFSDPALDPKQQIIRSMKLSTSLKTFNYQTNYQNRINKDYKRLDRESLVLASKMDRVRKLNIFKIKSQ